MDSARATINKIRNNLKGELSLLAEQIDELEDDDAQHRYAAVTSSAVWEGLQVLADRIDLLTARLDAGDTPSDTPVDPE